MKDKLVDQDPRLAVARHALSINAHSIHPLYLKRMALDREEKKILIHTNVSREERLFTQLFQHSYTTSTGIAESTFLKRGCYKVIHEKPGDSTSQTVSTNHSRRPSQYTICQVCSRPNHLIGCEAVKVRQTMTANIIHYGQVFFLNG